MFFCCRYQIVAMPFGRSGRACRPRIFGNTRLCRRRCETLGAVLLVVRWSIDRQRRPMINSDFDRFVGEGENAVLKILFPSLEMEKKKRCLITSTGNQRGSSLLVTENTVVSYNC